MNKEIQYYNNALYWYDWWMLNDAEEFRAKALENMRLYRAAGGTLGKIVERILNGNG